MPPTLQHIPASSHTKLFRLATYLKSDDAEKHIHRNIDMFPGQNEATRHQLAKQVEHHKQRANEAATWPWVGDVVPLLWPLEPHADAVLDEGAGQAEASHRRQVVLAVLQNLIQTVAK